MQSDSSSRFTLIVFLVVIAMLIVGSVLIFLSRPEPVQITINPPAPTATDLPPAPILVYVTGAVQQSGITITLPHDSRVSDAIEAVGGVTENADLERVNLAGILRDGDQVHVPEVRGEETVIIELATPSGGVRVRINTATLEELQTLPGVGPAMAQRIIDYRDANGAFQSLEDLDAVQGIGPAMLRELQPLLIFD